MACVVVPAKGFTVDSDSLVADLTRYLRTRVASYKVPTRFLVTDVHSVPQTDTGKVSKRKLREILEATP